MVSFLRTKIKCFILETKKKREREAETKRQRVLSFGIILCQRIKTFSVREIETKLLNEY